MFGRCGTLRCVRRVSAANGKIIVVPSGAADVAATAQIASARSMPAPRSLGFGKGLLVIDGSDGWAALDALAELTAAGVHAELDMLREHQCRYIPDDPLFEDQWHLLNVGQGESTAGADGRVSEAWGCRCQAARVAPPGCGPYNRWRRVSGAGALQPHLAKIPKMHRDAFARLASHRLSLEHGRRDKQAPLLVGLLYPSRYPVGMSSLGLLHIYRCIQNEAGMACERFFLPDDAGSGPLDSPPLSYERLRPLSEVRVVALSVAYELQLAGVVQLLRAANIPPQAEQRDERHALVIAGGPLTFSNPLPLAAFADAIVIGEGDDLAVRALSIAGEAPSRAAALRALADLPHVLVPAHHGTTVPPICRVDDALLPAWASLRTPDTELSDMFLIEAERGCSHGCRYCVMSRHHGGGMRLVAPETILALVPDGTPRVGLVGAAVSDHPAIVELLQALFERGMGVGLSSLRPGRISEPLVAALARSGHRTLTTALDGASARVREIIDRRVRVHHLQAAAHLAREHGMARLKLYLMLGVPGERDEDVDEAAALLRELSAVIPIALAVSPFCAKKNTPLDGQPFAGVATVRRRLGRLRRALKGRVSLRSASARWAWVEHCLAQGGLAEGLAVEQAVHAGGRFSDYKRALGACERARGGRRLAMAPITQLGAAPGPERAAVVARSPEGADR